MSGPPTGFIWQLKRIYWGRSNYWGIQTAWRRLKYRHLRRRDSVIARNSCLYRIHRHNDVVSESIYVHGTCAKYVTALLQSAKASFNTFIDVGANIGSVTIPVAKGFGGRVLSIEPSGANYTLLTENIALNGVQSAIDCVQVAIGDRPGQLPLYHSSTNTGDHRLSRASDEGERGTELVNVVTLDSLVVERRLQPPYLVKVDVQGYEAKVLASASSILKNPCVIVAEFWPYGLRVAGSSIEEFSSIVAQHHLTVYEVSEERVELRRTDLQEISRQLSEENFDDSRDLVLTNMPIELTGLNVYLPSAK